MRNFLMPRAIGFSKLKRGYSQSPHPQSVGQIARGILGVATVPHMRGALSPPGPGTTSPLQSALGAFEINNAGVRVIDSGPGQSVGPALYGLGDQTLSPGLTFKNNDAYSDFTTGLVASNWRDNGGDWPGVPQSLITAVTNNLIDATNSYDPRRNALADSFKQQAKYLVSQLDEVQHFGIGGRSDAQDRQYRSLMQQLKSAMINFVAAYGVTGTLPTASAPPYGGTSVPSGSGSGPSPDGATLPPQTNSILDQLQRLQPPWNSPGALLQPGQYPGKVSPTGVMPPSAIPTWALALGGVVVVGGVLLAVTRHHSKG